MDDISNTRILTSSSRTIRRVQPQSRTPKKKGLNHSYVLLSILIGTLLWFGVDIKRKVDLTLDVRLQIAGKLPAEWKVLSQSDALVRVTLRGAQQDLDAMRKDEVAIVPEFPAGALDGDTFDGFLNLSAVGIPPGIEVLSMSPGMISVRLSKTVTKYVTVEAGKIAGAPQEGYVVGNVQRIDPPAVPITASKEFISKIGPADVIRTREFSVEGERGMVGRSVGLEPFEKDGETVQVPGTVYMTVELSEMPVQREFEEPFEVRALIESPFDKYADLNISPPTAKVTVGGPKTVIDKLGAGEITIYADLRDRVPAAPGEFNIRIKAITPSRVRVVRIEPDTVKWITRLNGNNGSAETGAKAGGE